MIYINGNIQAHKHIGQMAVASSANTTLALADTYYKILGTWTDGILDHFSLNVNGTLTFIGTTASTFLFNGTSDVAVDKACLVTYVLYLNGSAITETETPHTFINTSKVANISATRVISISPGDTIEIYAKSSEALTILTVSTLATTFWGK